MKLPYLDFTVPEPVIPVAKQFRNELLRPVQNWFQFRQGIRDAPELDLTGRDVLLIVVDCLRADHLSSTNYHRKTTPFIDTLETTLTNTISAGSFTYPSVASILSGLYPHNHGAVYSDSYRNFNENPPDFVVDSDVITLSELLCKSGYELYFSTAIATAEIPVRGRFPYVNINPSASADVMLSQVVDWWANNEDANKFAYVHLGDLHEPLTIPERHPFGPIRELRDIRRWRFTDSIEPRDQFNEYKEAKIKLYDTILAYVDQEIQEMWNRLSVENSREDPIILITGDHGEAFWDHTDTEKKYFDDPRGFYGVGHGHSLFQEVVNVPILTNIDCNENEETWTSTTDIFPTILDVLGTPHEFFETVDGESLTQGNRNSPVLSEELGYGYDQRASLKGSKKLIISQGESIPDFLFDLSDDPYETNNLNTGSEEIDKDSKLFKCLQYNSSTGGTAEIDSVTQDRLEDLGYLE